MSLKKQTAQLVALVTATEVLALVYEMKLLN